MPVAGSKRKASTAAAKKNVEGAATRKRTKAQRPVLDDVSNADESGASQAPCKAGEGASTARMTRTRAKAKKTTSIAAPFQAFVEDEFQGGAKAGGASKEVQMSTAAANGEASQQAAQEASSAEVQEEAAAASLVVAEAKPLPVLSGDPLLCSWYTDDIFKLFRNNEADFQAPGDYMENLERDINAQMRGILIDWIVEVGEMYNLHDQTIYLCTNYLDRYVATHAVPRSCLQLVGVTCLQIASKYSEVSCPTGEQFAYISVTPIEEIMKMERKILDALDYRLCVVSALDFCAHYCRACEASEVTTMLARYFLELTLQEYGFLSYPASVAAATAVKIALWYHDRRSWDSGLSEACDHAGGDDLKACAEAMQEILVNVHKSTLPAVKEKYSHSKCLRVSEFCFESLALEEEETKDVLATDLV